MADENKNVIDLSKVPGIVTIENTTEKEIKILSRPGYTQGFVLPAKTTVKLQAEHSFELVSFLSQEAANPGLIVTLPGDNKE